MVRLLPRVVACSLVQPARLELALLDPQIGRKLGIVAANVLDEPLRVLRPDEHLERVTYGKSGDRASSTTA